MMMLRLIIKLKLRQQQQSPPIFLLPMRRLSYCRTNDPETTRPTTEPIAVAADDVDDYTDTKKKLLDDILTAGGSLGDMEATLQRQLQGLRLTPSLLAHAIHSCCRQTNNSSSSSRRLLRFFSWYRQQTKEQEEQEASFNQVIRALAEMRDLTAMQLAISDLHKEDNAKMDPETFACAAEALVRSGRANEAVHLFRQQHLPRRRGSELVVAIVHALCEKGHVREAKCIAWRHRDKLQGGEEEEDDHHRHQRGIVLRSLLHGWCVHGNVREARQTMDEMRSLDILPGHAAYHDFLRCVCNRNLKFNPSALVPEATDVMTEMRRRGVPVTAVTYNILLSSLGRTRRVKESCRILNTMEKEARRHSPPDRVSYYLVARVLYLTRRFGRGHMVMDRMSEEAAMPNPSAAAAAAATGLYRDLIGVLCGMNEVGHALQVFDRMKAACGEQEENNNWRPTYDMLIAKLCASRKFETGRVLWDEAVGKGICLQCSKDLFDPLSSFSSKTLVFKPVEKLKNTNHHNTIVQKRRRAGLGVKRRKITIQWRQGGNS